MTPRLALTLGAVAATLFGLALLAIPVPLLAGYGITPHVDGIILARDVGATLLGLGVLNWLARDVTDARALRALLLGNLAIQVLELVLNGVEIALGTVPLAAAPGETVHLILAVVFGLALRKVAR